MKLGNLLKEAWRTWARPDMAHDPTQNILHLVQSGNMIDAFAVAETQDAQVVHWGRVAQALQSAGKSAEKLLYLALRRTSERSSVLVALGHWLAARKEPLRAFLCAETAHHLSPAEPAPLLLMGWLQLSLGNPQSAGHHFLAALRRDETHPVAWQGYRAALQQTQAVLPPPADLPDDEDQRLLAATAAQTDNYRSHLALGKHYATTSRCVLALPHLRKACALAPRERDPVFWLAWSLFGLGENAEALFLLRPLVDNFPADTDLVGLAADCAIRCAQEAQAIAWIERSLAVNHENAALLGHLGLCCNHFEDYVKGAATLARALVLDPSLATARHNLAFALHCLGRYEEARSHLDILLETERNDFSARWYRSGTLLAAHDFRAAWPDYEFRFAASAVETRIIPLPAWQGESLVGKKIVVIAEQGIGDEIMFASCIPELLQQAGHCVIECNRRLVELYRRSFPQATVVEWVRDALPPWLAQHADADFHVFCGSLPLHFRGSIGSYRNFRPYLVAAPDKMVEIRQRIESLGPGLKVGIAWRGGSGASRTRSRSLSLEQLRPLLDMNHCSFVSIQYGDCAAEVDAFRTASGLSLAHWPELVENLDDFAALVAALDIIVTVCSAPVHFAGAQGKPALVLTPYAPEWRYHGIDGRMIWYPDVRLLPQQHLGDWNGAIDAAAEILAVKAQGHHAA